MGRETEGVGSEQSVPGSIEVRKKINSYGMQFTLTSDQQLVMKWQSPHYSFLVHCCSFCQDTRPTDDSETEGNEVEVSEAINQIHSHLVSYKYSNK